MGQGNYDHPSYLTRQQIALGKTTAGNAGTSSGKFFVSDMRVRKVMCSVITAGTSANTGNKVDLYVVGTYVSGFSTGLIGTALTTTTGTTSVATFTLGSSIALSTFTTSDLNIRLVAGSMLFMKNGTDATGVADLWMETYIDPEGSWTGQNN